jgi:hypothetical protein
MVACFKRWVSLIVFFLGAATGATVWAADALTFTTLAGTPGAVSTSIDATGSAAQFSAPRGIAVDSAGNLYVADSSNHTIRKVTAAGVVTTLAGTAGTTGTAQATPAKFHEPFSVATDSAGNVYVADTNNNAIRKITPAGVVTTLAGGSGMGSTDGTGSAAKFAEPHGVVLDSSGNVYVTDYVNMTIRKVTPAGVVTTLAGSPGVEGFVNGTGAAARFKSLQGIAIDTADNLYIADSGNRSIRKITPAGVVTTFVDGTNGQLGTPRGIVMDSTGTLYVTDYSNHVIYRVTSAGAVSRFAGFERGAGVAPQPGSTDGTTATALFNAPSAVAVDSAGNLYIADTSNNTVRKIASGNVTTLAGQAGRSSSVDGKGSAARFEDPYAVAVDGSGIVYVADATDHSIRKITTDGTVTTFAGTPGTFGSSDGTGTAALFKNPQGIAADSAGNVYVADTGNATVRKITSSGVVTTLAGSAGSPGNVDATGPTARFSSPYGIAVDGAGTVYVVDSNVNIVRKITAAGVVTTLAGTFGQIGLVDGTGAAARFAVPFDIAVDTAGNLYICDHGNHAIRKVTPAGVVTTLAGSGLPGKVDGTGSAALFKFPAGISVDTAGYVYVADTDNQVIRKISPAGVVTTIAGSGIGSADGVGTLATFNNPKDIAVDTSGNVYVVDRGNHTIRKGSLPSTTNVTVSTGWNLLGHGSTAALAFSDVNLFGDTAKVASVWKWRNSSGKWAFYSPALTTQELSDYATSKGYEVLTSIAGGEGFWVNAKTSHTVSLPVGTAVTDASFQGLSSGWHLISTGDNKTPAAFGTGVATTTLWAWDNAQSKWYFYAPSLEAQGGTALSDSITAHGYLDFRSANKTLGSGVGFWVNKP